MELAIKIELGIDDDSDRTAAAAQVHVSIRNAEEGVVGTLRAVRFDPYAPDSRGMLEEGDAIDGDSELAASIVYNHDRSGEFNAWWIDHLDIEVPHGRMLLIAGASIKKEHRGAGLALLAMRRLINVLDANLVVLFLPMGTKSTARLERYYKQLGFRRVPKLDCSASSYQLTRKYKLMFLDPSRMHRSAESGWKPKLARAAKPVAPKSRPDETLH